MNIPLDHFEHSIEPSILKKGLSYFKNNKVVDFDEVSKGQFEATVEGTEDYTVQIQINNGAIVEKICSCPYDIGPVCKHIAAVLFYMQQDELNIQAKAKTTKSDFLKPKSAAKTVFEKFEETLSKLSQEELKRYLLDYAKEEPGFRKHFMMRFKPTKTNNSKEYFVKQVQAILRKAKRKYGYIDTSNARVVGIEVGKLNDVADQFVETENWEVAFNISTAIIESLIEVYGSSDDSYGEMGASFDNAILILWEIAISDLSEDFREMFFNYCASKFQSNIFSEWGHDLELMSIAVDLLKTEQEGEYLLKLTHEVKKSEYIFEKIQKIQFDIIYKSQGEEKAILFLEKNLKNEILLEEAIKFALKKAEYEKAIKYAHKGIEDSKGQWNRNGLKWYKYLLNIAEIQNDTEKIVEYATYLLLNSKESTQVYLTILKNNIAPQDWNSFIDQLISDISKKDFYFIESLLFNIFTSEERWADLIKLAQKTDSLRNLETYEKILSTRYPQEMSEKYSEFIIKYLKENVGRDHYQLMCRCIRRMKKWGPNEIVLALIEKLRQQHPSRYALLEELDKV
jgi:uncharacterized Zn finger protein